MLRILWDPPSASINLLKPNDIYIYTYTYIYVVPQR